MSDILGSIFEVEEKAKAIVEEARTRQAERRAGIETEASGRLTRARDEARELIKENVRAEKEKAEARLQDAYDQAEKRRSASGGQSDEALEALVDEITRIITTPEYEKRQERGRAT